MLSNLQTATLGKARFSNFSPVAVCDSVKKLLTDALNKNQYLKRLELQQIKDMVECMYEHTYQQGEYVIKQGEPGNHLFVLAGTFVSCHLLKFERKNKLPSTACFSLLLHAYSCGTDVCVRCHMTHNAQ